MRFSPFCTARIPWASLQRGSCRVFLTAFLLASFSCATVNCFEVQALPASLSADSADVHVKARLIADTTAVQPGKPFKLGVELKMQPHWHTYYKDSGDAGLPTKIEWGLPKGFKAGPLLWVKPEKFDDGGIVTYGYKDQTLIAAEITAPADLKGNCDFTANVKWLVCSDSCIPGGTTVNLSLPVDASGSAKPNNTEEFSKVGFTGSVKDLGSAGASKPHSSADAGSSAGTPPDAPAAGTSILDTKFKVEGGDDKQLSLIAAIGLALVGGMILNVMPCVLPVIAIKVLSFFEQARDEPARVRLLGLTFSAGIISSFMVLAAVVIAVQATGRSVGWGLLFQFPPFLIGMASVVLLFTLSLFGMFYVSAPGAGKVDELASKEGFTGTFFKGVLATLLSTPCTAPFLGTAVGFAFTQPGWVVGLIFFTVGLGMSLPYLLLCINPSWMKFMPKPGVWMEKFKESLGFVLLATVAWLLGILGSEVGIDGVVKTTYFLIAISFATWLVSRFTNLSSSQNRKFAFYGIAAAISGLAFYLTIWTLPGIGAPPRTAAKTDASSSNRPINWQPFTIAELDKAVAAHKTVLLDFTADWCLTCKYNEQTVLDSASVVEKLKALNVVTMQADWTLQDRQITALLNKFGRSGVPLYVIFPADKASEPIVLPEVITQGIVLEKLDQAGPSK